MDIVTQDIQATLAKRPDVVEAEAGYQNNLTAPESASVDVKVKAGTAFEPIIDESLRLIWQSNSTHSAPSESE
ncbi:MAG TPA: hypothetical protein VK453_02010 [Micromonosporaceae bacterium]|nr:hypothetical protein [Micromonosporaceae bacterium]